MGNGADDLVSLKQKIAQVCFVSEKEYEQLTYGLIVSTWLFNIKKVLLEAGTLDNISALLLEKVRAREDFQIGGVESAAIPLISGIIMKSKERGIPANGFFIRKGRKKGGMFQTIEGSLGDERIVLVDDIMNTGKSFIKQIEVLESVGKKVDTVLSIIRFRDMAYYEYFHKRGIMVLSLFTLDDFKDLIRVENIVDKQKSAPTMPFQVMWRFQSEKPNYFYVVPKSAPAIDDTRIYFGSDVGVFWALNQEDGSVAWKHTVMFGAGGKMIFSSPALSNDTVFFGAYDGNFYALDKETGKKKWVFMEADWIGSSPCISDKLGLVYVGLEFGLWKKQGGIAALSMGTGKKVWEYPMPGLTHSSPAYSARHNVVVCGCNDNTVYALHAKTGALLWKFETGGEVKTSFAFDEKRGLVCFGSFDTHLYILNVKTGALVHKIPTGEAIYSTPLVYGSYVYIASLDKNLYCVHLDTGAVAWKFATNGRIFSSPEVIDGKIYIGSNDGRLYELDAQTGTCVGFFQTAERITNKLAYNKQTRNVFLPTFANEIYCLTRKHPAKQ